MSEFSGESSMVSKASAILNKMELTWQDLEGKTVLDAGAGEAALAQGALMIGSTAKIFSIDDYKIDEWSDMPGEVRSRTVQALAQEIPFPDNHFDLILNNAAAEASSVQDQARVLKPGGEIRISPISNLTLELWYIGAYLQYEKGFSREEISEKLMEYESFIKENDGTRPAGYEELEEAAITSLSFEEKVGVIDSLLAAYTKITELPFTYVITNPDEKNPDGYILYTKPGQLITE